LPAASPFEARPAARRSLPTFVRSGRLRRRRRKSLIEPNAVDETAGRRFIRPELAVQSLPREI
jgi:hypothetical protein